MVDDSTTAGKRFSKDLRQIREERDVSIDEIHNRTRIARTLIESFEEGRLYTHESYNDVYLRSFVQAYAEAIDISVDDAVEGLNAALEGAYEDALAEKYVHAPQRGDEETPSKSSSSEESTPSSSEKKDEGLSAPSAGGPEGRGGIVGPPRAVGEDDPDAPSDASDAPSTPVSGEGSLSQASEPSEQASEADSEGGPGRESSRQEESPPEPSPPDDAEDDSPRTPPATTEEEAEHDQEGDDDAPDWLEGGDEHEETEEEAAPAPPISGQGEREEQGPDAPPADVGGGGIVGEPTPLGSSSEEASGSPSSAPRSAQEERTSRTSSSWTSFSPGQLGPMYLIGAGVLVVLLSILVWVFYFSSEDTSSPQPTDPASTPDTSAAVSSSDTTASEPERPPPANLSLGETLHLTVRARANVSNLRIRRDDDLRRPYWIQEGEIRVFPFEEEVTLQNELGDIELLLEGYAYPIPSDTTGGIEITRSGAQSFADTLRGPPVSLSVTPDTIPVGAPAE